MAAFFGDLEMMAPAIWAGVASAWEGFARAMGTTLVTSLWQGGVIACVLEICLRVMPRISAAQRFAIWAAGFGAAAGLPLMGLMHFAAGSEPDVAGSVVAGNSVGPFLRLDARWGLVIAGLWVAASALRAASLVVHSMRLRRLWKTARPADVSSTLTAALKNVRGGGVTICTTDILNRPSVIGFLAPRILIPAWLIGRLTPDELEQIVLHEAEHLRRGDDWTNLVQKLWLVAFPLNPAMAWMEHRLCQQREMACDEGVVRITNAPRAYAACLASLAERGLERRTRHAEALSLGAWHRRSELVDRVQGILLKKRNLTGVAAGALLGAVGCTLVAGSVEMARAPQLVAFVPEQRNLAMTQARQRQMREMLTRESAEAKLSLPAGFHAVQTKAIVPESDRPQAAMRHEAKKCATAVRKSEAITPPNSQQMAKAEAIGDRVNSGDEQQWVVLAAWQEVRTVSRTSISDYDTAATTEEAAANGQPQPSQNGGNATGKATSELPNQTSNYTVTQLILRVVPANSKSTQPVTGLVRGGWFVFQL
ncbi:M56 family metallopeptidase [Telmatobacter sp. DSM 110680]|uniref:M56 family metallopeptidase n=1 Tax=Telmatobacter sp. DSM 110680 TaxID=3036704 RepID=A0AAU7DN46_9BACT